MNDAEALFAITKAWHIDDARELATRALEDRISRCDYPFCARPFLMKTPDQQHCSEGCAEKHERIKR